MSNRFGSENSCYRHGHNVRGNRSKAYSTWAAMKSRCTNKRSISYKNYGARGISVCSRWLSFGFFYEDMGPPPSPRHSIDRINNDLGYFKKNCRWADAITQSRNRRKPERDALVDDLIIKMYSNGCSIREISALLEKSEHYAAYRLKINGVARRDKSHANKIGATKRDFCGINNPNYRRGKNIKSADSST